VKKKNVKRDYETKNVKHKPVKDEINNLKNKARKHETKKQEKTNHETRNQKREKQTMKT
jgi:hypothetical protein